MWKLPVSDEIQETTIKGKNQFPLSCLSCLARKSEGILTRTTTAHTRTRTPIRIALKTVTFNWENIKRFRGCLLCGVTDVSDLRTKLDGFYTLQLTGLCLHIEGILFIRLSHKVSGWEDDTVQLKTWVCCIRQGFFVLAKGGEILDNEI